MTMREPLAVGESTARAVLMERSIDKAEIVAVGGPFRGESCEYMSSEIVCLHVCSGDEASGQGRGAFRGRGPPRPSRCLSQKLRGQDLTAILFDGMTVILFDGRLA